MQLDVYTIKSDEEEPTLFASIVIRDGNLIIPDSLAQVRRWIPPGTTPTQALILLNKKIQYTYMFSKLVDHPS